MGGRCAVGRSTTSYRSGHPGPCRSRNGGNTSPNRWAQPAAHLEVANQAPDGSWCCSRRAGAADPAPRAGRMPSLLARPILVGPQVRAPADGARHSLVEYKNIRRIGRPALSPGRRRTAVAAAMPSDEPRRANRDRRGAPPIATHPVAHLALAALSPQANRLPNATPMAARDAADNSS